MRFNWIFVNPIQKPGRSGSLYSVADPYAFNPLLVDPKSEKKPEEQVRDMIARAEGEGVHMMTDLVVNHCATDSRLLEEHPEWFLWEGKGKVAHPFAMDNGRKVVWKDLAKFDHQGTADKDGLFRYFLRLVEFLLELGFKAFRCDAAYQVPVAFWRRLIAETKAKSPDCLFFAETLGCSPEQTKETASAGFDYIFNSSKWWDYESPWLLEQYNLTREIAASVSFAESHDTRRLLEECGGNIDGVKQRYLFAAYFSAGVMMTMGFEFGFQKKLHVVTTRPEDWETTGVDLTPFITAVNRMKETFSILQEEAPTDTVGCNNRAVLLMRKRSARSNDVSLLVLNKDIHSRQSFFVESLDDLVRSGTPLADVSPEYRLEHVASPFACDLRPGQGIVLVTESS